MAACNNGIYYTNGIDIMMIRYTDRVPQFSGGKMRTRTMKSNSSTSKSSDQQKSSSFSKATMEVAKRNLQEFETQSEKSFVTRAEMDRKLSSL